MRRTIGKVLIVGLLFSFLFLLQGSIYAIVDIYANYAELSAVEIEGVDYEVDVVNRASQIAIIAVHGGKIEKGTSEIAKRLSSDLYTDYYSFKGTKISGNLSLHITAVNFDEPRALTLVGNSLTTVSVHGCSGTGYFTIVGGRDDAFVEIMKTTLSKHGFTVVQDVSISSRNTDNIANRNIPRKGLQLEISRGLRDQFFTNPQLYSEYVSAVEVAILEYMN